MRHLLTDLRGNPIYSFAQRRLRGRNGGGGGGGDGTGDDGTTIHHRGGATLLPWSSSSTAALFFMIQNRSWNDVLRRSRSHPHEVTIRDDVTGNTPLHCACRLDPPPAVVRALSTVSRVKNREGATPLHVAASHRCSPQALLVLIECAAADPVGDRDEDDGGDAAAAQARHHPTADLSRMGRAPIHYACMSFRGLELDAFKVLFDATLKDGHVMVDPLYRDGRGGQQLADSGLLADLDEFIDDRGDEDWGAGENDDLVNHKEYFYFGSDEGIDNAEELSALPFDVTGRNEASAPAESVRVNVLSMRDATGQTPLGLLFRRYRERVRCIIKTVDRIRREHADAPDDRAALVAAMTVHVDLGELWDKSRWIVARLTEERLAREEGCDGHSRCLKAPISPGEVAVAQEAAKWAAEQYRSEVSDDADGVLELSSSDNESSEELALAPLPGSKSASHSCGRSPARRRRRQFRIVHASVGLTGYGCPPEMVRLAISMHPRQVREMDEDGNLPLHIAATAGGYLATADREGNGPAAAAFLAAAAAAGGAGNNDEMSVLSDTMSFFSSATVSQTTNPFDKVIKILLQHYPEAARIPQGTTGQLPLVMAVESGKRTWQDGICTLLNAYPPALLRKKLITQKLFSNVLALVERGSTRQRQEACARTTLFELLRTKPEWLDEQQYQRMRRQPNEKRPGQPGGTHHLFLPVGKG